MLRHSTAAGSRRQTPPQVPCPLPPPRVPGPQADQPQYHRPESRIDPPPLPWATPPPGLQADQPQYHRLEAGQSLRAALVGKTLVEYPTIIVALPKEADTYPPVGQGGGEGAGKVHWLRVCVHGLTCGPRDPCLKDPCCMPPARPPAGAG